MEDDFQLHFDIPTQKNNEQDNKKVNEKAEKRKNKYQSRHLKNKGDSNKKQANKPFFQSQERNQNQIQNKENEFKNKRNNQNYQNNKENFQNNKENFAKKQHGQAQGEEKQDQPKEKLTRKERKEKYKPQSDKQQQNKDKLASQFTQKLSQPVNNINKNKNKQSDGMEIEHQKHDEQPKFDENGKPIIFQMENSNNEEVVTDIFSAKKFEEIPNLHKKLDSSLKENKWETLTRIQHEAYPDISSGDNVAIKSETGSGKTLAYLVPLLNNLLSQENKVERNMGPLLIIIVPTRELAIQCQDVAQKLLHWANNVICGGLLGGENPQKEKARLRKGVNVLFATPGRLLYHLKNTESFKISNLKTVIFEESDRTLDMGFKKDLEEIVKLMGEKLDFDTIQKVLISAHFSEQIEKLCIRIAKQTIKYVGFSNSAEDQMMDEENNVTAYIQIDKNVKVPKRLKQYYTVVGEECRIQFLIAYLHKLQNTKTIVFLSTCSQVEYFEMITAQMIYKDANGEKLTERILPDMEVYKLHGNIDQKERSNTYFSFKNTASSAVLYSTDVAARGLDFPEVTHTIIFEIPPNLVDYCNRIGRTARMDKQGISVLVLNKPEEDFAVRLQRQGLNLNLMESRPIFKAFERHIKVRYNIGEFGDKYLEGMTRSLIKSDKEKHSLARSAYISSLRAYARLTDRTIFRVKQLNLNNVAKSYGLSGAKSDKKETKTDEYQDRLEKMHKNKMVQDKLMDKFSKKQPRQALNVRKTIASEFM